MKKDLSVFTNKINIAGFSEGIFIKSIDKHIALNGNTSDFLF